MIPGEYILAASDIVCNANSTAVEVIVVNTGDRPVQVGSHYHFFEVNRAMEFDRTKAYGKRLDIAAGTAVRFEPGEEKVVSLIDFGGDRIVQGFNNLVDGKLDAPGASEKALEKAIAHNFKHKAS